MKKSISRSWPYLLLALAVLTIVVSLEGYITIKMMTIVDAALAGQLDMLKAEAFKISIAISMTLIFGILTSYTRGLYLYKSLVNIKMDYVEGLFDKNINEFQAENNAIYLSAITNDMNSIEKNYFEGIYSVGNSFIAFIVAFIVIASVSPMVLFLGASISIVSGLLAIAVAKPLQRHEKQRSDLFQGYTSYIKEVLSAFQIVKANNLDDKVREDFSNKSKDIQEKRFIIDRIHTYILSLQSFLMNGSFIVIMIITCLMALRGTITAGAVILIINNMSRVIYPLRELGEWFPKIFSVKGIFEKMDASLQNQENYLETIGMDAFNECIEFKDVSFAYGDKVVLSNINLSLKRSEKYLIIGPSGGGKSTLLKLLRKYFNPTKGQILIDGKNLKDIKKRDYFNILANIEQEVFLFEDSLRNNICLYKEYGEDEIELAIERAGLSQFVKSLPEGLDTMIYDNGKNISGGERSRVAIARGLLAKSDIIFLDEAFASLDAQVAREIEETLLELEDITIVNVSHVLFEETKDRYDKVLVVKDKSVLGQG
ncbi:MAG: ABC transporter ATP-binding protein [Tissierellaceae bacterium]|nr:ABC transporter ATP-binding protein [Tissierellia bacterium]